MKTKFIDFDKPYRSDNLCDFFNESRKFLASEALRYGAASSDIEDCIQECYLLALEKKVTFPNRQAFVSWSRKTLRFKIWDQNKKNHKHDFALNNKELTTYQSDFVDNDFQLVEFIFELTRRLILVNPQQDADIISSYVLNKLFSFSHRYLAYAVKQPLSTFRNRLDRVQVQYVENFNYHFSEDQLFSVFRKILWELIRYKLMLNKQLHADEVLRFPYKLKRHFLSLYPEYEKPLSYFWCLCLLYAFRRLSPVEPWQTQLTESLKKMKGETSSMPLQLHFQKLRCARSKSQSEWNDLKVKFSKKYPKPVYNVDVRYIVTIENAMGWEAAYRFMKLCGLIKEPTKSFYTNFLAGYYAFKNNQPKIARRFFKAIEKSYCPELFRETCHQLAHVTINSSICDREDGGNPLVY